MVIMILVIVDGLLEVSNRRTEDLLNVKEFF